jgi:hypothetical protein
MQILISKEAGIDNPEKFVFQSEITGGSCSNAKEIAVDKDAAFEMLLPGPEKPAIEVTLNSMIELLKPDEETENLLRGCYTPANMLQSDKIAVSYLSVTCSGRVELSIAAPEMDGGKVWEPDSNHLKIGLGFLFQAGIRFLPGDMQCPGETQV